jgi:hypothetical protein
MNIAGLAFIAWLSIKPQSNLARPGVDFTTESLPRRVAHQFCVVGLDLQVNDAFILAGPCRRDRQINGCLFYGGAMTGLICRSI